MRALKGIDTKPSWNRATKAVICKVTTARIVRCNKHGNHFTQ